MNLICLGYGRPKQIKLRAIIMKIKEINVRQHRTNEHNLQVFVYVICTCPLCDSKK